MPGANELILFDDEDKSLCDKGQLISKQILFQDLLTFKARPCPFIQILS